LALNVGTPKAFDNSSPGLPQPWVKSFINPLNSEGVPIANRTLSVFLIFFSLFTQG
jgi:hypothetical protein